MTITWISGQRNKIRRLHERPPKFLLTGEENANIMKEISGLTRQTDKLEFGGLARSAVASPGGKLSSAARLMRNGEMFRLRIQFVKKYNLKGGTFLFDCVPYQKVSPFLIRPCGAPSPRGKVLLR